MELKHTATPWHCKQLIGVTERGFALLHTNGARTYRVDTADGEFSQVDAEFIVRACNAHDDFVAACKAVLADLRILRGRVAPDAVEMMRAALSKAGAA